MSESNIAFFGGEPLGVAGLEALKKAGLKPKLVVCSPDRKSGRGLKITAPGPKIWALENNIEVFQPESFKDNLVKEKLIATEWDLFIVVAYNFILPKWLLDLPAKGCLNVHPSLLPALRGPSPIRTAILKDQPENVGVSIMLLDEKMDHGPLLYQKSYTPENWPTPGAALDTELAHLGGQLLTDTVPAWLEGNITPQEQNHQIATYTEKFVKGANELSINPHQLPAGKEAQVLLSKIRAWQGIGDTFFIYNDKRIKVKTATLTDDDHLQILSIVPEGKKEMLFTDFFQS